VKHEDRTPEWHSWAGMRTRCTNPGQKSFKDYGGRGITVDPRWRSFDAFLKDMGPKPSPGHTLDRVHNDGPYVWWNCRWSTWSEQMRNRRAHKRPGAAGEGNPQAKLTWAVVREIRALKGREPQDRIARRFGVSASAIGFVLAGRTWREPLTIDQN
jgi:hypothetical protein